MSYGYCELYTRQTDIEASGNNFYCAQFELIHNVLIAAEMKLHC